jgi:hypothetical protein
MCSRREREKYKKHAARQKDAPKPPKKKKPKVVAVNKSGMAPRRGSRYFAAGDNVPR